MAGDLTREDPLVFRIPPYLVSAQFLIVAGLAAWNIYGSPAPLTRAVTILLAVAFLVGAVASLRMFLVVDDDGIGVRRLFGETSVDWRLVRGISVVRVRNGSPTLLITCNDGTTVTVPPSLVNPSRPTGTAKTMALMSELARRVAARNPYRR